MRISILRGLAMAIPMIILGASSASAALESSDEICGTGAGAKYGRTLWGLCTAAVAARCAEQPEAQQCVVLAKRWQQANPGDTPPWLELVCEEGGTCTVFVTSTTTGGTIGGLAGGDAFCQARADAGATAGTVPAGVYRAWLSTTGVDGVNAKDRVIDATSAFDADFVEELLAGCIVTLTRNPGQGSPGERIEGFPEPALVFFHRRSATSRQAARSPLIRQLKLKAVVRPTWIGRHEKFSDQLRQAVLLSKRRGHRIEQTNIRSLVMLAERGELAGELVNYAPSDNATACSDHFRGGSANLHSRLSGVSA